MGSQSIDTFALQSVSYIDMPSSNIPVIIGVGDIKNRSTAVTDAKEPATLMLEAIQKAISDTSSTSNTDLQSAIDSVDVVKTWTWPYPDLPGLLAEKLGIRFLGIKTPLRGALRRR